MPPTEKGRMKIKALNDRPFEIIYVRLDPNDLHYNTQNLYEDIVPSINPTEVVYVYLRGGYWQYEFGIEGNRIPEVLSNSLSSISTILERMC
ncbi:hypothetical protein [Sporocytophaga myxococcoides]|uniref:hypothetical protein n=1 Tax=Sporocytophaga myxococcoides TaxID=153721 RepID=UPI00041421AD|nr:hypothetical protein [Sporocytophaga myxococcoides]